MIKIKNLDEIKKIYPPFKGKTSNNFIDETGNKYGKLTVLYRTNITDASGGASWVCKCDCGNITKVTGTKLRQGKIKSCGCLKNTPLYNLTGYKFDKLTVLEPVERKSRSGTYWKCRCECGEETIVLGQSLRSGATKSCGCNRYSKKEKEIISLLKQNNILYEKEKTFSNLKGKNNIPYRYDFYLPEYNRLIEYNGIQHYKCSGWNTQERFCHLKDNYEKKKQFALKNKIDFVEIPYTEKISLDLILGDKYLVKE